MRVTVHYPFHPWHGRELEARCVPRDPQEPLVAVDPRGGHLEIPRWMTSPEAAQYVLCEHAHLEPWGLRALAHLLCGARGCGSGTQRGSRGRRTGRLRPADRLGGGRGGGRPSPALMIESSEGSKTWQQALWLLPRSSYGQGRRERTDHLGSAATELSPVLPVPDHVIAVYEIRTCFHDHVVVVVFISNDGIV